jgi:putative transport protein
MTTILRDNPLLLLFLIAAIGYPLGRIKIAGSSLGVAAVLFAGIAVSATDQSLKLPEIVYQLGLVLFVYTIGLANGRTFFQAFKREGVRANTTVLVMISLVFVAVLFIAHVANLKASLSVGMFAGSLTNTPALATALEYLTANTPKALQDVVLAEPVVGYSLAYPMGVVGMLLAIALMQRIFKIDYAKEARELHEVGSVGQRLHVRTIRVTQSEATSQSVHKISAQNGWDVAFSRVKHNDSVDLVNENTQLAHGDLVTVIGETPELEKVIPAIGEDTQTHLEYDRTEIDYRRIIVSNPKLIGHKLADLDMLQQFGALVTRIKRGDIEFLPQDDTVLELGDRLRVVARRERMKEISRYLGDSFRSLSEIDIMTFSLGLALGLLLGVVPIPLPGGITVKLGMAGGPLIVALILGAMERTGPFVWNLPYNANLTLRQIGLILFLAGVGSRAGYAFVNTLTQGGTGLLIFGAGATITLIVAFAMLFIGYRILKLPFGILIGMLAGLQTQPAVLGYALEQSQNELPNVGYAEVYPVATIAKIIFAQVLLTVMMR